jgi:hypothetical protein
MVAGGKIFCGQVCWNMNGRWLQGFGELEEIDMTRGAEVVGGVHTHRSLNLEGAIVQFLEFSFGKRSNRSL